jgi:hypothetical protein
MRFIPPALSISAMSVKPSLLKSPAAHGTWFPKPPDPPQELGGPKEDRVEGYSEKATVPALSEIAKSSVGLGNSAVVVGSVERLMGAVRQVLSGLATSAGGG